jgi:hypothetical protein
MKNKHYIYRFKILEVRIINWLYCLSSSITPKAQQELDIPHSAADQVQMIRAQGCNIVTEWTASYTDQSTHRIASYIQFVGGE